MNLHRLVHGAQPRGPVRCLEVRGLAVRAYHRNPGAVDHRAPLGGPQAIAQRGDGLNQCDAEQVGRFLRGRARALIEDLKVIDRLLAEDAPDCLDARAGLLRYPLAPRGELIGGRVIVAVGFPDRNLEFGFHLPLRSSVPTNCWLASTRTGTRLHHR